MENSDVSSHALAQSPIESRKRTAPDGCSFWLEKRKRFCKTAPTDGLSYCKVHIPVPEQDIGTAQPNKKQRCEDLAPEVSGADDVEKPAINNVKDVSERPEPKPDRCHLWLERKRRYCNTRISGNRLFCVEHSPMINEETGRQRVPCPNDPKHSCYADQLLRHLNRCNARAQPLPSFHVKGINSGTIDTTEADKVGIRDVDTEEVFSIISTVRNIHKDLSEFSSSVEFHQVLREEVDKPTIGLEARRHLLQQASLVGNMQTLGLLKYDCHYVEFGAGKGGLSHWVQLANKNSSNCQYLLVDKSSVRYKMDSYHKGLEQGPHFERLKIDIENLDLAQVPSLIKEHRSIVCTGKHLCGSATDLMLTCVTCKTEAIFTPAAEDDFYKRVEGVVLALCCHHRCEWRCYAGKSWFSERGLTARQFSLIVSMSAWATCATPHVTGTTEADHTSGADSTNYNHPRYGSLLPEEREKIGVQCKQLLDAGRLEFLREKGFDARVIYYTDRATTLENMAIVATRGMSTDDRTVVDSG